MDNPLVGILFLGRKRPGFDQEWGKAMTARVREAVDSSDLTSYEPKIAITDDTSLTKALNDCTEHRVDVVVALQTTMSDARLARTLCQQWSEPIVLWATPEKATGAMISSNSLVGVHNWASNLYHYDRGFEIVYGDPDDGDTIAELRQTVRILYAARRLRTARAGIIGGQAPGFFAMAPDAHALHTTFGAQTQQFTLPEFYETVESIAAADISEDVQAILEMKIPYRDAESADIETASRLYLALKNFQRDNDLDALALRCWPEMPGRFGQWPYLGMARLADAGIGIAMEGDGDGALAAAMGHWLGMGPAFLTDWLEHDSETITFWHAGNIPFSLSPAAGEPGGPRLARHFNNQKPLVIDSETAPGTDVTVVRLWNRESHYLLTAFEGRTTTPKRELMGSQAAVAVNGQSPHRLFDTLCHEGMPHHALVFRGHHGQTIRRFARVCGVEFIGDLP